MNGKQVEEIVLRHEKMVTGELGFAFKNLGSNEKLNSVFECPELLFSS